jgi:hypothetical protein
MTPSRHGAPFTRQGWRRRARALFLERLGLKATALAIAVLLWFVVGARQPTESRIAVRLIPELDSSLALLGDPPQVQALVAGRAADLAKLYATPPVIRRTVGGDAPDTLVLDVLPGDVRIPPELKSDVRVLDIEPRRVMLRFETRASRRVAVVNGGRVNVAGGAARVQFEPETVRITGPRRVVRALRGISPDALTIAAGDTLPHVAELDTAGLGVRVSPAQVKVRVNTAPAAVAP